MKLVYVYKTFVILYYMDNVFFVYSMINKSYWVCSSFFQSLSFLYSILIPQSNRKLEYIDEHCIDDEWVILEKKS